MIAIREKCSFVKRGITPKYAEDGHVVINQKCIKNGKIDLSFAKKTSFNKKYSEEKKLTTGDILINSTGTGTLGRVAYFDAEKSNATFVDSHVSILRVSGIEPKFLFYFLSTKESYIESLGKGSTNQIELSPESIKDIEFPDFDIEKQKTIVRVLSDFDDLIENCQKQVRVLEESIDCIFNRQFSHITGEEAELEAKKTNKKIGTLSELCEFKRGKTITEKETRQGDIPVVAGGLAPAYYHDVSNTLNPVITVSASGANAGFTRMYYKNIWASDCSFLDCRNTKHLYFVYCLLKNNKKILSNMQKGSAQPHVYAKDLNCIKLMIPHHKELDDFETMISPFFDKIKQCTDTIEKAETSKKLILIKFFSNNEQLKKEGE